MRDTCKAPSRQAAGLGPLLSALLCVGCQQAAEPLTTSAPAPEATASGAADAKGVVPDEPASPAPPPGATKGDPSVLTANPPPMPPTVGTSSAPATSQGPESPVLRNLRVGEHPEAERVVFEFDGVGLPAWNIEYVDRPVRDCGQGKAVAVAGDAWLQVRFSGAQAHDEQGKPSSGARRRSVQQPLVRELVLTCDFEGEVTWVIGLSRPNGYTPRALSAPSRLVVDIKR